MKTEQPLLLVSILATVLLLRYRFATTAGAVPAAGAKVLGVVNAETDAGSMAPIGVVGVVLVESGAAIAADADVQTDALGRAITLAGGANSGRVLDAASAAGQFIRIIPRI